MRTVVMSGSVRTLRMPSRSSSRSFSDAKISSLGSGKSMRGCSTGRAIFIARRSHGYTLSSHQRAASGNVSSCSVSPVGAQSTMSTSCSPRCA